MDLLESIEGSIATLTLNRPDRRNALDGPLVASLSAALKRLDKTPAVRVVILDGAGGSFCAGADIAWMKRVAEDGFEANVRDAGALAELLHGLDGLSKPSVAVIRGPAYGGGVGLVACCDVALASEKAEFRLSETRLGLVPAVIGPFLVRAIGARQARRFVMTAERITAARAMAMGLVHECVPEEALDAMRDTVVAALLAGAPGALAEAKALVAWCAERPVAGAAVAEETARRNAERRFSPEGREGLAAFLERRAPSWRMNRNGGNVP